MLDWSIAKMKLKLNYIIVTVMAYSGEQVVYAWCGPAG